MKTKAGTNAANLPDPDNDTAFWGRRQANDMLKDCEAIFIRSTTYIDSDLIENTPIKYIGSATSGFDHIDNNYLNWNSIDRKCFIAKGCNSFAVVNYVLACLGFLIKLKNFSSADSVGIIGYGNIGSLLSKTLDILGLSLIHISEPTRPY